MKIYEVMKELHENKNKVARNIFTATDGNGYYEMRIEKNRYIINAFDENGERLNSHNYSHLIDTEKEWEIIEKLVTFEEVLNSNKKCRVEHLFLIENEFDIKRFDTFDSLMFDLSDITNSYELKDIIKNGKWYLED